MSKADYKYKEWLNSKFIEEEVRNELLKMSNSEIVEAFHKDIEFGTGGLRAKMGAGTNRMNIYTVRRCAEGYARYIETIGNEAKERGIVIAYDNRHNSKLFAEDSAKILSKHGIKSFIFDSLRPTPELSFAIRYLDAWGGIVVTASHNPKEYNGYKIYDANGCQCVPKCTDEIIKYITNVNDYISLSVDSYDKKLIRIIGRKVDNRYYESLLSVQVNHGLDTRDIKIVYSPLHGTGYKPISHMLTYLGYDLYLVENQCIPDENFSYVESMNPEDKISFKQAIELAKKHDADLVITTDPDCDRLGICVLHQNKYVYLSGNQIGAIMINYILEQKNMMGLLPKNGIVFNSIVTSDLGASICKKYNVEVESTLTGFKYIGDKIREYDNEKTFLFGYEESNGFLIKDFCRDKDAVQGSILISEIVAYYKQQNKTLIDILNELFDEFGYVEDIHESLIYEGIEGLKKINDIMDEYRYNTPTYLENRKVIAKEDYKLSIREDENGIRNISFPKANAIKLYLEDGSWIVIRPSGNEPLIKLYKNLWRRSQRK